MTFWKRQNYRDRRQMWLPGDMMERGDDYKGAKQNFEEGENYFISHFGWWL